jgi:hypothetical protein
MAFRSGRPHVVVSFVDRTWRSTFVNGSTWRSVGTAMKKRVAIQTDLRTAMPMSIHGRRYRCIVVCQIGMPSVVAFAKQQFHISNLLGSRFWTTPGRFWNS